MTEDLSCTPNTNGPVLCTYQNESFDCEITFDASGAMTHLRCDGETDYECVRRSQGYQCTWSDQPDCADVYDADGLFVDYVCGDDMEPLPPPPPPPPPPPVCPGEPVTIWDSNDDGAYLRNTVVRPTNGEAEAHIVAIYESSSQADYLRTGLGDVRVSRTGAPIVLILSAYSRTEWTISADPGVDLRQIVIQGVQEQTVASAPAGVAIVNAEGYEDWDGCALDVVLGGGVTGSTCGIEDVINGVERDVDARFASLTGVYTGSVFTLGNGHECNEPPAVDPTCRRGCDRLPEGEHLCSFFEGSGLTTIDLESGDREFEAIAGSFSYLDINFARIGDYAYTCSYGTPLQELNLVTGALRVADLICTGVAAYNGGLLVMPDFFGNGLRHYASFDDVLAGVVTREIPIMPYANQIHVRDEVLYASWHSTDRIERFSLTTGDALPSLLLEGYNTWILGFSTTTSGLLVVNGGWPEGRIAIFDRATGENLKNIPANMSFGSGMSCE